jgi:hypothetical protein
MGISLTGVGYGTRVGRLRRVVPLARGNRVIYQRHGLSEWYVNGPLGLEQGFTLTHAPAGHVVGAMTLAVKLAGNAHASLSQGGRGITLVGAGKAALRYDGLSATDARGRLLHSWMQLDRGRVLLRVDTRGARYPLRIDPFTHQGIKLTPAGPTTPGDFGVHVAMSADGTTALIVGYGAGWVFTRSGETWTQQGEELTPSGGASFGSSVALSADGNTALISSTSDGSSIGAAWVFTRSGETWSQQGEKLTGSGETGKGEFGAGVALSGDGNTALIGARRDHANAGAAYVFVRSGGVWTQSERITGSGEVGEGRFGEGVALSQDGNTAMIGAGYENKLGAAYVFSRTGEVWTQQGEKLTGSGETITGTQFDFVGLFGSRIALSEDGNDALVGAAGDAGNRGAAFVFTRSGETWTQQGGKLAGLGEVTTEQHGGVFGASVALSADGSTALIGGPGDGGALNFGAAWVFTRSGETWTQQGGKLGSGEKATRGFGAGVALSGDGSSALVGNPTDGLTGAAWVFGQKAPPEPPDLGRCVKTLRSFEGYFGNSNCTTLKTPGNYEWLPGVGEGAKFTSTITEGLATFETVKLSKVVCTAEAGTGQYTSAKTVGGVTLTFTGCERSGEQCKSSGAAAGEIVTHDLEGELGIEKLGATARENKIGLDLFPVGNTGPVAEFTCGATEVSLRGSVILPVLANKMLAGAKLKFTATKGKQKPEKFVEGAKDVLEASFNNGAYEQIGLTVKITQTNEEALEVDSAF